LHGMLIVKKLLVNLIETAEFFFKVGWYFNL
jgi:hypothetical protein